MVVRNSLLFKITKLLFFVVLIEAVIGGSGRIIEFGPLTLKMVLFGISFLFTFFNLRLLKFDRGVASMELFFAMLISFSALVGLINYSPPPSIFEDIKPLLSIFMLNFFLVVIQNVKTVRSAVNIIKYFSLAMAIVYIVLVILLTTGILNFNLFYALQENNGEVMFRNSTMFFYKGFLYLGVGFIFLSLSKRKIDKIFAIIVFIALCLTLTRGMILMTAVVYIYYIYFINKSFSLKAFTGLIGVLVLIYFLPFLYENIGDKGSADMERFITIDEVLDEVNFSSFFIGHGFGQGVPIRPVHMEISYLEIFHKQGVLGLCFWLYVLFLNFKYYLSLKSKELKNIGLPFLLSVCFTFLQSFTNPFVNNPIGISIIMLSLAVLYRFTTFEKKPA